MTEPPKHPGRYEGRRNDYKALSEYWAARSRYYEYETQRLRDAEWDIDPEGRAFLEAAQTEMAPKLKGSALALHLMPTDTGDAKFWVELGAAIMFEKPLVLVVREGALLPQKLQSIAAEIIYIPADQSIESMADEIGERIRAVLS